MSNCKSTTLRGLKNPTCGHLIYRYIVSLYLKDTIHLILTVHAQLTHWLSEVGTIPVEFDGKRSPWEYFLPS